MEKKLNYSKVTKFDKFDDFSILIDIVFFEILDVGRLMLCELMMDIRDVLF